MNKEINWKNEIKQYYDGKSEFTISKEFKISRNLVRCKFLEFGVLIRNASARMTMMNKVKGPEGRATSTKASHDFLRGRKQPLTQLLKKAKSFEKLGLNSKNVSEAEKKLLDYLIIAGLNPTPQKQVHIYNLDIGIENPKVDIEIFGGHFHATGRHKARFPKRTKYLLDNGWKVIIVWCKKSKYINRDLNENGMREVALCAKYANRNYISMFGNGEPTPENKTYLNDIKTRKLIGVV